MAPTVALGVGTLTAVPLAILGGPLALIGVFVGLVAGGIAAAVAASAAEDGMGPSFVVVRDWRGRPYVKRQTGQVDPTRGEVVQIWAYHPWKFYHKEPDERAWPWNIKYPPFQTVEEGTFDTIVGIGVAKKPRTLPGSKVLAPAEGADLFAPAGWRDRDLTGLGPGHVILTTQEGMVMFEKPDPKSPRGFSNADPSIHKDARVIVYGPKNPSDPNSPIRAVSWAEREGMGAIVVDISKLTEAQKVALNNLRITTGGRTVPYPKEL